MSILHKTVALALKEKAPALHKELAASGKLNSYLDNLTSQISSDSVDLTMQQRMSQGWDKLGSLESARRMKTAHAMNREAVLADALEFPQDETSPPSQGETTDSATTM